MHRFGFRSLRAATALLTLAAVAAGCRSESDTTTPPDGTPPNVISRYPATGDAEGTGPFVVTFDEPLDSATVTPDEVQVLQASGAIPSSVALSTDGKTVTITPAVPLAVPGWVQVKLGAGLRDRAGNAFQVEPSPWLFEMAVWGEKAVVRRHLTALDEALQRLRRHVLVHAYLDVDPARVHAVLDERLGDSGEFARAVEAYVARQA